MKSAAILVLSLLTASCTVAPKAVPAKVTAFSGSVQDAGVKALVPDGAIVNQADVARYNSLLAKFPTVFTPRLKKNSGITPQSNGLFLIDSEHLADFLVLSALDRQAPSK